MTREEAIKILRDAHDKALFSVRSALETLIPELHESDDERMRKSILRKMKACKEQSNFFSEEEIDYLEKQKEQPKEELVYRLNGLMQDYIKEGKDEEEKEHRFKCYKLFWDALEDAKFFEQKEQKLLTAKEYHDKFDEMYGQYKPNFIEQKPAGWGDEDEYMLNSCISSIEEAKENRYAYKETDGDTSYDYEIDWLKSLRPSWKPSEEQMEVLRKAVNKLANTDVADSVRLSIMYDNLKKLM